MRSVVIVALAVAEKLLDIATKKIQSEAIKVMAGVFFAQTISQGLSRHLVKFALSAVSHYTSGFPEKEALHAWAMCAMAEIMISTAKNPALVCDAAIEYLQVICGLQDSYFALKNLLQTKISLKLQLWISIPFLLMNKSEDMACAGWSGPGVAVWVWMSEMDGGCDRPV